VLITSHSKKPESYTRGKEDKEIYVNGLVYICEKVAPCILDFGTRWR
jgi:hypothetical protein